MQAGDPTNTGKGGKSIYEQIGKMEMNKDEKHPLLKHRFGTVSLANKGQPHTANSQFFILTSPSPVPSLDKQYTIIGEISEGMEVVQSINRSLCQKDSNRPYQAIRIQHTIVLDNPLKDKSPFKELINSVNRLVPSESPPPITEFEGMIHEDEDLEKFVDDNNPELLKEKIQEHVSTSRAKILEMMGDMPHYDMEPPKNMLFVCKLNPITKSEDLEIIFSRFGRVKTCDVIKDKETGDSLCFGFVGYETVEECENAYLNMQSCVIDDRLVRVDFSQSVAKLWKSHWEDKYQHRDRGRRRGREEEEEERSYLQKRKKSEVVSTKEDEGNSRIKKKRKLDHGDEYERGSERRRKRRYDDDGNNNSSRRRRRYDRYDDDYDDVRSRGGRRDYGREEHRSSGRSSRKYYDRDDDDDRYYRRDDRRSRRRNDDYVDDRDSRRYRSDGDRRKKGRYDSRRDRDLYERRR